MIGCIVPDYLQPIIKGWYMSSLPVNEGDTTVWYTSYWHFIATYANNRFGNDWSLSAEQSLAFYSGYYVVPKQVVIRASKAGNNIIQLKYGDTLLDVTATLPRQIVKEQQFGLNYYSIVINSCKKETSNMTSILLQILYSKMTKRI